MYKKRIQKGERKQLWYIIEYKFGRPATNWNRLHVTKVYENNVLCS